MTALVTGGGAIIGSHLAEALRDRGDTVCVRRQSPPAARENVALLDDDVELVVGDATDAAISVSL